MWKKGKRRKTVILLVILLLLAILCYDQNNRLTVSRYEYESLKVPEAFDGYTIVQISDLHSKGFGTKQKKLLEQIRELTPDLIVVTGDIMDSYLPFEDPVREFLEGAARIAPVYYVTGNHEYRLKQETQNALWEMLQSAGVTVLRDSFVEIRREEASFLLIGLDDESVPSLSLEQLVKEIGEREDDAAKAKDASLRILLAHEPQYMKAFSRNHMDLVFSGHAHGGQFRIPGIGGLVAPGQGILPEYTEGVHIQGDTSLYISRGLGNSVIPLRLNNYPEIVCVTLKCKR